MDRVVTGASLEPIFVSDDTDSADEKVVARASVEGVEADTTVKRVVAGTAVEGIEAGAAIERVGAVAPSQHIVAGITPQTIAEAVSGDLIIVLRAADALDGRSGCPRRPSHPRR